MAEKPSSAPAAAGRAPTSVPGGRVGSLDGLRGIAALVVVVHHAALVAPALAEPYRSTGAGTGAAWLLAYTPLHLPWAGGEAVVVFFVLSGLVLSLPFLREQGSPDWRRYYGTRLPRLYLPVWASLAVCVPLALLVPRRDLDAGSWWVNAHDEIGLADVIGSASLLAPSFSIHSGLWSLRWELLFCLLLPAFLAAATRWRELLELKVTVLLAAVVVGGLTEVGALLHLPVFGLGVLMAVERQRLADLGSRVTGRWRWTAVLAVVMTLLLAPWLVAGALGEATPPEVGAVAVAARALGAALVVFLFTATTPFTRWGSTPVPSWLGARAFSLYLVHEPVVVALAFLLRGAGGAPLVLVLGLPLSVLLASLFHRWVELPSQGLARAAGQRASAAR